MSPPSSTSAPQLSPVRPSSPLKMGDFAVGGDNQADEWSLAEIEQMRNEEYSPIPGYLESGAPETPEEAAMSSGSPSPGTHPPASTVTGLKSAGDKTASKLETVPEDETTDNHTASRHPGEDTVSATIKRKTVVRETIIEEEDEPEAREQQHDQEHEQQQDGHISGPARLPPLIQSHLDKEQNFQDAIDLIEPKIINAPETITKEDANLLISREQGAHGVAEKGVIAAQAQSLAAKNELETDAS